jgi:small subunit ribosomal protein S6
MVSGGRVNEYELMLIVHPRLNADETAAAVSGVEARIASEGGELLSTDVWGRRRLAYPIDRVLDGTYVLMTLRMEATAAAPLEGWLRIQESLLRHLLIRGIIPYQGHRRDDRDRDRDDRDRDDRDRDDRDRDEGREVVPAGARDRFEDADPSEDDADESAG